MRNILAFMRLMQPPPPQGAAQVAIAILAAFPVVGSERESKRIKVKWQKLTRSRHRDTFSLVKSQGAAAQQAMSAQSVP